MSVYIPELDEYLSIEEAEAYAELKEEERKLKRDGVKKRLLEKYRDKFSDELKSKYNVK